jgi:hypothetical protein
MKRGFSLKCLPKQARECKENKNQKINIKSESTHFHNVFFVTIHISLQMLFVLIPAEIFWNIAVYSSEYQLLYVTCKSSTSYLHEMPEL